MPLKVRFKAKLGPERIDASYMTLDGLEQVVHSAVPRRARVYFIRYAHDFIMTGKSRTILVENVLPTVKRFLAERGLELSEEKTRITHIRDGFTFLTLTL